MRISTTAHYASRLLAHLALENDGRPIPAAALSSRTGISVKFIEKIIRPLKSAGLVRSIRGASGGHILCIPPHKVTLGQVLKVVEGGVQAPSCCSTGTCAHMPDDTCASTRAWNSVTKALEETLEGITLADLMEEERSAYPYQ